MVCYCHVKINWGVNEANYMRCLQYLYPCFNYYCFPWGSCIWKALALISASTKNFSVQGWYKGLPGGQFSLVVCLHEFEQDCCGDNNDCSYHNTSNDKCHLGVTTGWRHSACGCWWWRVEHNCCWSICCNDCLPCGDRGGDGSDCWCRDRCLRRGSSVSWTG